MKARGAKRIRYPCSPGCKRCPLDIGVLKGDARAVGKPINGPPGKYGRKAEIFGGPKRLLKEADLRELAGKHTRGGGCGSIRLNARNLTRGESRMKVRLMVLPNTLSGGAWPSSVRVV